MNTIHNEVYTQKEALVNASLKIYFLIIIWKETRFGDLDQWDL